jgi:hypothetical protein
VSHGVIGGRRKRGGWALQTVAGRSLDFYKITDLNLQFLEAEGHAATHGARRLHQVESASVPAHHRHVSLR